MKGEEAFDLMEEIFEEVFADGFLEGYIIGMEQEKERHSE